MLLYQVLRTDSDLDAFLLDYFPDIKRRLGSGMTRDAKVNLLLESVDDLGPIYSSLRSAYPDKVAKHMAAQPRIAAQPTPAPMTMEPSVDHAGRVEVLILTALGLEYQAVRAHLLNPQEQVLRSGTVVEVGQINTPTRQVSVALIEAGIGDAATAGTAQEAITHYEPTAMFFVGVAGGIKDVALGDIVVATKVYGYEAGKAEQEFLPRPDVGQSSYRYVQRARAEARRLDWLKRAGIAVDPTQAPQVFIGPIAAGSALLASTRAPLYQFLRHNYGDTLAVEMEGRGFLATAHRNASEALIVRGISDLIDDKAASDKGGSQQRAAKHAAAFAIEVLAKVI